ncbi:Anaphase-promoting complex (APC) subunit 11 protein [Dioscorea alata]|uniref:Anaphase-promoting complex (APC) subunit 11 protein n=1 Tax=Dioscorea alata TaxID=55571 RepID=A0ACB7WLD1_DIOAL|nr:Anaphase-promoting complex (APC) subunit 11 protein [Dioscorea alata]
MNSHKMNVHDGNALGHHLLLPEPPSSRVDINVNGNQYRPLDWPRLRVPMAITIITFILLIIWHCDRHSARHPQRLIIVTRDGLNKAIIASFPILRFEVVEKIMPREKCGEDCSVCLSEFVKGDDVRLLTVCGHAFHPNCIDTWLGAKKTCPVCRADLTKFPSEDILAAVEAVQAIEHKEVSDRRRRKEKGDVHVMRIVEERER